MVEQQGGGNNRQYTEEDVELLLNETAKRGAAEALKNTKQPVNQHIEDRESEDELIGVSPKLVKQLQATVGVFNTLKEFASNPLQKAIESKVGELAAGVIESAFSRPSGPPPKRDLIETILNSQFAFGLGNGLGQRGPELVESMGKTFGKDRAGDMVDGIIGKYGKGQGEQSDRGRQLGTDPGTGPGSSSGRHQPEAAPEQKQSEKELLLSLDPNNPEHVAAYAETQGGLSVDVARKMLMIHQDEFIKQMKNQGADVSQISTMRGSHSEKPGQAAKPVSQQDTPRSEQPEASVKQADYAQSRQSAQQPMKQDNDLRGRGIPDTQEYSEQQHAVSEMEYTEFQDVPQSSYSPPPSTQYVNPPPGSEIPPETNSPPGTGIHSENPPTQDSKQAEMMTQFANDIGKVMGDMVSKIETLNNTVFVLQNELGEIKRKGVSTAFKDSNMQEQKSVPADISEHLDILSEDNDAGLIGGKLSQSDHPLGVVQTIPDYHTRVTHTVPRYPGIRKSEDFFEENIHDASDFARELEEEARASAKKFEEMTKAQEEKDKLDNVGNVVLSSPMIPTELPASVQSAPTQSLSQPLEMQAPVPIMRHVPLPTIMAQQSIDILKDKEARSETQEAGSETQEAGSETQEAGSETQEAGSKTQEAGSETQEAGSENEIQEVGSEKQEERVHKIFVMPIKTADIRKNIYTPSLKPNIQLENSEENKGTDNKGIDNIKEK